MQKSISCLLRFHGPFAFGETGAADVADGAIATPGGAVFAAVKNDLEMELVPNRLREKAFEVFFGLRDVFTGGELPALGEAVDVSIDREAWHAEGLRHDDLGGLVADSGEFFECIEIRGHLAAVLANEDFAQLADGAGFLRSEAARADDGLDLLDGHFRELFRDAAEGEKGGRDLVHPHVRALGREQNGHEQGKGIRVVQWDGRIRIQLLQTLLDKGGTLDLGHDRELGRLQALLLLDALGHLIDMLPVGTGLEDGKTLGKGPPT